MLCYTCFFIIFAAFLFYKYLTRNYGYWKKISIPSMDPNFPFGNMKDSVMLKKALGIVYEDIYKAMPNEPMVGFYRMLQPALLLRDPELIKDVLVKSFDSFHDNDFQVDVNVDPMLGRNPFVLQGQKWKIVRNQLSPNFTAGRMKSLAPLIVHVSNYLVKYIEELYKNPIDCKETSAKYTTDVIATCVFGLEGNSFTDPGAEFRQMGRLIIEPTTWNNIVQQIVVLMPLLQKVLNSRIIPLKVEKWFRKTIGSAVQYRKEQNYKRPDFLQALMELREKPGPYEFTMEDVFAHSVLFFTDGFETSSTLLSFAFYELAKNKEVQNKLHAEILNVLKSNNNNITYEAIQEMTYLDMVISETLRKYPPIPQMNRICTKDHKIGNVNIETGTSVVIPTIALHYDPKYYPNPEVFDPDRFSEENIKTWNKYSYMPWGKGPRICLGMRLAQIQSKIGIVVIVRNFDLQLCKETPKNITFKPNFLLASNEPLLVKFNKRND